LKATPLHALVAL